LGGRWGKADPDGDGAGSDVLDEEIFAGSVGHRTCELGGVGRGDGAKAGGQRAGGHGSYGDGCIYSSYPKGVCIRNRVIRRPT